MDLIDCQPLLKHGGILVFDDINHPKHKYLDKVWDEWIKRTQWPHAKSHTAGHGVGLVQKPV